MRVWIGTESCGCVTWVSSERPRKSRLEELRDTGRVVTEANYDEAKPNIRACPHKPAVAVGCREELLQS